MNWICSHCGEKFSRFRTRCPHDGSRVIEDLTGQLIGGRYRIRELVGVGGMDSTVWKAWQTGTERTVAIKVLPPADEAAARRFSRGARIAANLNHPNCSIIHDYGKTEDGKLYLVMEFLQGQVLQEMLGPSGSNVIPVGDVIHIAIQVLQALEHAHAERAVHRDLKPDNLYLTRKNDDPLHVKILDFGIAKYVEEDPTDTSTDAEEGTADGFEDLVTEQRQVCGTPQYMAPEQVVGARIDQRTDLYSLGVVMYRMLTGRLPFDGKTRYELYQKHLQEAPRPFGEVRPDLNYPERLELVVQKALMKRPDQRFQTAAEMRKALETIDLVEGVARRNNRPRVALKDTSPQSGSAPTILPPSFASVAPGAAPFTLSQPSPVADVRASTRDFGNEPTLAREAAPAAPPPLPARLSAALPPPPLPNVSGDMISGRGGNTAVAPAVTPASATPTRRNAHVSGAVAAPAQAGAVQVSPLAATVGQPSAPVATRERPATDLLNDAVLRHPASRISQVVVVPTPARPSFGTGSVQAVPRSTETQPNTSDEARDSRRRKLTVAAILTGAFGLGVGGVALVMKLTQPASDDGSAHEVAVSAAEVAAEPLAGSRPGEHGVRAPNAGPSGSESQAGASAAGVRASDRQVAPSAPTAPQAPTPATPEPATADTRAGQVVGQGLSEVSIAPSAPAPSLVLVRVESDPPGATVREGATVLGTTPCGLELSPGKHQLTLERLGSKTQLLDLDAQALPGAGPILKKVQLEPLAAATPRTPPGASLRPTTTPPTPRTPPAIPTLTRDPVTPPTAKLPGGDGTSDAPAHGKPTVKLLDDGEPTPGKKPTVKLLDDGDAPATPTPKPKVKVLDE